MPETPLERAMEYRLGQLDTGQKALLGEMRLMRSEFMARFAQHDQRDDERFNSHATRLTTIEKQVGMHDAVATATTTTNQHRLAKFAVLIGLGGAVIAALINVAAQFAALHFGGH